MTSCQQLHLAQYLEKGKKIRIPKENIWKWVLEDASVTKKVSSESWVRSFIKEIDDFQKLDQIGEGETEILGLKIDLEKGIVQRGYPDSIGKSYFDMELLDTGSKIRVYEDNSVSVWYGKGFKRLRIEQLEEVGPYFEPLETDGGTRPDGRAIPGADLTSILTSDHLDKIGFFSLWARKQRGPLGLKVQLRLTGYPMMALMSP